MRVNMYTSLVCAMADTVFLVSYPARPPSPPFRACADIWAGDETIVFPSMQRRRLHESRVQYK